MAVGLEKDTTDDPRPADVEENGRDEGDSIAERWKDDDAEDEVPPAIPELLEAEEEFASLLRLVDDKTGTNDALSWEL